MALQETHYYDGQMIELINILKEEIKVASQIHSDVKHEAFCSLFNTLSTYTFFSKTAASYLILLLTYHKTFYRTKLGNPLYDPLNGLHACDLLWLLYVEIVLKKNEDYAELFTLMLEDMQTGVCPQGICTRCFQILIMMKNKI